MSAGPELTHGTAIGAGNRALIIQGASGSGKSDLALRCLLHPASFLTPATAFLIADDQVSVERRDERLLARAPNTIRGKLEVRGLGVIEFPAPPSEEVPVAFVVALTGAGGVERLPNPPPSVQLLGVSLPVLRLAPFEASAAAKVLLALALGFPPRPNE